MHTVERLFRFKKFSVRHERSAMKVGTDGVLLGAWCRSATSARILDVGTGCGLIALMMAQRFPDSFIDAVEIDPEAITEAMENFEASPWGSRLTAFSGDFQSLLFSHRYGMIVSNPPWYDSEMKPPKHVRSLARHSDALSPESLISRVAELLETDGCFSVILPVDKAPRLMNAASTHRLKLIRQTFVRPTPSKPPHRILMEFSRRRIDTNDHNAPNATNADELQGDELTTDELIVETEVRHDYTPEFRALLREFFLRF